MKVIFLTVGQLKKSPFVGKVKDYTKRVSRYLSAELCEVKDSKVKSPSDIERAKQAESLGLLKKIKDNDFVVALDERGKPLKSTGLADLIDKQKSDGTKKRIVFIVGGAYGLDRTIIDRADFILRLSDMILTHDLALLVITEQVYRAMTILNNEPYSH